MSDVFQGPGWWMASDGKWYPPENHPDERYRARFVGQAETPVAAADQTNEFPTVELRPQPDTGRTTPFTELARSGSGHTDHAAVAETAELSGVELEHEMARVVEQRSAQADGTQSPEAPVPNEGVSDAPAPSEPPVDSATASGPEAAPSTPKPVEEVVVEQAPTERAPKSTGRMEGRQRVAPPVVAVPPKRFSVASPEFVSGSDERPVFEPAVAPSVVESPRAPTSVGHTEVEIDRPIDTSKPVAATIGHSETTASITSSSTALVHLPNPPTGMATARDRVISGLLFVGGIAMIVGSFLQWTTGSVEQSGWERGDGIVTVIAGVLGASMAGPIFVGFRHTTPKAVAIVAGVVAAMVMGLVAMNSVVSADGVDFGLGVFIVAGAAAVTIIAGVSDQGEDLA